MSAVILATALQSAAQPAAKEQSTQKPGDADFSALPKVEDMGGSLRLTFAVTKYTDVTVEVVDAAGKRVRALASGKLGPNPPAPLQTNSLKQTLTWDKKTETGQPAPAGCRMRVGLGLTANLDRIYDANGPGGIDSYVLGATTDDQGNVYVLSGSEAPRLTAFSRDNNICVYSSPILPIGRRRSSRVSAERRWPAASTCRWSTWTWYQRASTSPGCPRCTPRPVKA
jgi:hypothetical protein